MDYKIMLPYPNGGDEIEKAWWHLIGKEFPCYEKLWSKLIVPLTKRPQGIDLKEGIEEKWEQFAEQHYSIYIHLAAAIDRNNNITSLLAYEDVYSHLGTVMDLVESFLFSIDWIVTGTRQVLPPTIATKELFAQYLSEWARKDDGGGRILKKFEKSGRVFAIDPFHESKKDLFEKILAKGKAEMWKSHMDNKTNISMHRNNYIHDVARAKIICRDGRIFVLKDGVGLAEYSRWSKVKQISNNEDEVSKSFIDIQENSTNDILCLLSYLNKLWEGILWSQGEAMENKLPKIISKMEIKGSELDGVTNSLFKPIIVSGTYTKIK